MEIKKLLEAIDLASNGNIRTVEIDVNDLVTLKNKIEDLERVTKSLTEKLLKRNAKICKLELEALERPIKLDLYV